MKGSDGNLVFFLDTYILAGKIYYPFLLFPPLQCYQKVHYFNSIYTKLVHVTRWKGILVKQLPTCIQNYWYTLEVEI